MATSGPPLPWRVGDTVFDGRRPVVMGVVNTTPDSFSDGGLAFEPGDPSVAVSRGLELVADGADIVDVGGESTRPGAAPVALDEELARTVPVVSALADEGVVVSIDTTKARVAEAALDVGALVVNDVSAGRMEPAILDLVVARDVACVMMHMQGSPETMQVAPVYDDAVVDISAFLVERRDHLVAAGLAADRVVIDPGIGFGKTLAHNLELLAATGRLAELGPVLVGASRKSFMGKVTGIDDPPARDPASIAVAAMAVHAGALAVRVHDVAGTRQAVDVAAAVRDARPAVGGAGPGHVDEVTGS